MTELGEPVPDWCVPERPPREILQGVYVRLEPLEPKHGAALYHAFSQADDNADWDYMPIGPFETEDDYMAWLHASANITDTYFYAIIDQASGQAIGQASYLRIDPNNGSIEVGWISFSRALQRTPGATEAMYLMMGNAFALGYRRYEWKCNALNRRSRRAAQRLGLSYEGIFRQATVVKGRNRDTAWFAAIDKEWPQIKEAFEIWLAPDNFNAKGEQIKRLTDLTKPILVKTDPSLSE